MNVAAKELCQELYELSGWGGDDPYFNVNEGWYKEGRPAQKSVLVAPAYDLGYLLRKLPSWSLIQKNIDRYEATSSMNNTHADTPEDAACKLAIELFKQGILTKETPDGQS